MAFLHTKPNHISDANPYSDTTHEHRVRVRVRILTLTLHMSI